MPDDALFSLVALQQAAALQELRECSEATAPLGYTLSETEVRELAVCRTEALRGSGRVEFAGGVLRRLALRLARSPYADRGSFAAMLADLIEAFYFFKTETRDLLSDDELIELLGQRLDEDCGGSAEALLGLSWQELLYGRGED